MSLGRVGYSFARLRMCFLGEARIWCFRDMVAHTYSPSTQEAQGPDDCEFTAVLDKTQSHKSKVWRCGSLREPLLSTCKTLVSSLVLHIAESYKSLYRICSVEPCMCF